MEQRVRRRGRHGAEPVGIIIENETGCVNSQRRGEGEDRNGIMRSQCPKYAMHAKEIGLRNMRSYHRPHLAQRGERGGLTHRAYGGRHHNKELKIKNKKR